MLAREDAWIQTFTGKQMKPLAPTTEMVDIVDIAHALSHCTRFAGHTKSFYSVAEHSFRCADTIVHLPEIEAMPRKHQLEYALAALTHDASEAYLVDIPTPIKPHLIGYVEFERQLSKVIAQALGVLEELYYTIYVKDVDITMCATEKRDLLGPSPAPWVQMPEPYGNFITPVTPRIAKHEFLNRYHALKNELVML